MSEARLPEKWIDGLNAAAAVAHEAASVLQRRLDAVADKVREVIKSSGRDDEAVHQLRVSTRRAQATILSFKPWLRKVRRKRVKRVLQRLRETAGVVRMCDVHRGLLIAIPASQRIEAIDRAACEFALVMLAKERELALAALVRTARRVPVKRLTAGAQRLIRAADDSDAGNRLASSDDRLTGFNVSVRSAGHAALAAIACEFQTAGGADLACRESLHQLRLCGKRLRYALEIFGAAEEDPKPLAKLGEHLAALQERLGEVNDHHEVAERLQRYADEATAVIVGQDVGESTVTRGLQALADQFESRCAALAGEFLQWWKSAEAGEFHRLIDMLAGREASADLAVPAAEAPEVMEERVPEVVVLATNNGASGEHETQAASVSADVEDGQER